MVLPIGIVAELLLLALVFLLKDKRKLCAGFLLAAMLALWVSSMPLVAESLMGRLERAYPPVAMRDIPASRCIVVLGGAVEPVLPPRLDVELMAAADRVNKAAELYHAGKGNWLVVAGGMQPWSPFAGSEAEAIKTLLVGWGVPAIAIVLDNHSRNTYENAVNSKGLMDTLQCETALLVTSAAHMQRSVATFKQAGVEVYPVSTDVRVVNKPAITLFDFLPDTEALLMTTDAMREWIGQKVYQFRGWN